jgi:hypothetical protein
LPISYASKTTTSKRSIAFMGNSGSLAARNIRTMPDEVGGSTPLILAVLQENHTLNLSGREIPKTAKRGGGKSVYYCAKRPALFCFEMNTSAFYRIFVRA